MTSHSACLREGFVDEVCRALGHDLSGQTSASFAMRQNFERCLLDYEIYLEREEDAGESPETAKRRKT